MALSRTPLVSGRAMVAVARLAARRIAPLVLASVAAPAAAATYTINITGPIDLGSVAASGSGDTVFRVDPATGGVTVVSGSGRRITTGQVRAQVNVGCKPSRGGDTACDTANVAIKVGAMGATAGRARTLTNFTVSMGTATLVGAPSGASPVSFKLAPLGSSGTKSFYIGADFGVAGDNSGQASGDGGNAFYASVVDTLGLELTNDTDKGKVRAFRALAIGKTSDLVFGRIQVPKTGTSTVSLNVANGNLSVSGGGVAYPTPAPARAGFTVTGEGGQQVSITIPTTLTLTGPGSLAVSLTNNAQTTPSLSGALGAAGTYSFNVGGSFTLTPTTPIGAYSGALTVSVDYN